MNRLQPLLYLRCRVWLWPGLLLLALTTGAAHADDDDDEADHARARRAVQAGLAMPLPAILDKLKTQYPGQVMEVELEREDGRWVYEIKLLTPQGQLRKLEVDARDATVLRDKLRRHR